MNSAEVTCQWYNVWMIQQSSYRSGGAIRQERLRQRRQRGFRCYTIEVCAADLDRLTRRGYLDRLHRHDPAAVERAIGAVLDRL